jgi:hypothetical protein
MFLWRSAIAVRCRSTFGGEVVVRVMRIAACTETQSRESELDDFRFDLISRETGSRLCKHPNRNSKDKRNGRHLNATKQIRFQSKTLR